MTRVWEGSHAGADQVGVNSGRGGGVLTSTGYAPRVVSTTTSTRARGWRTYDPELFGLIDGVFRQPKFRYARYDKR